jgi:uncharacterized coiled-coil protein SlyX
METLEPRSAKNSSRFWVTSIVLGVVTSVIGSAIWEGTIPEKIIDHYDLVRRSDLTEDSRLSTGPSQEAVSQLAERMTALETREAEQKRLAQEFSQKIDQIDQRLSSMAVPIDQPFPPHRRSVQYYSQTGRTAVEQQVVASTDSVAIITAYADAGRVRGKSTLLTLEISIDGNACASGQTYLYRGEVNELFVSAACMKSLPSRSAPFTIKATRKGQPGQPGTVHLQCVVLDEGPDRADSAAGGPP